MRSIMRHLQCILMSGEIHLFTFSNFLLIFADFLMGSLESDCHVL